MKNSSNDYFFEKEHPEENGPHEPIDFEREISDTLKNDEVMKRLIACLPKKLPSWKLHLASRVIESNSYSTLPKKSQKICNEVFGEVFRYIGENFGAYDRQVMVDRLITFLRRLYQENMLDIISVEETGVDPNTGKKITPKRMESLQKCSPSFSSSKQEKQRRRR